MTDTQKIHNASNKDSSVSYDVVIVGGGIVGLTLANALRDTDFSVAVIERYQTSPVLQLDAADTVNSTDIRVSAINKVASDAFKAMQLWPGLQQRYCAFRQMFVWDTSGLGQIHFDSADQGLSELGYIIENSVLVQALLSGIQQAENIQLYCPAGISSIAASEDRQASYTLALENSKVIHASLLVGADGGRSSVREAAAIALHRSSYHQQGLVCAVATEKSHQNTAWQCFLASGPLAFLPLFNGHSSIVWSLDDERAEVVNAMDDAAFRHALAEASEYQLGDILDVSQRKLFPLAHGHVDEYVRQGLALVGDAAHTIHPLAGQGANLGIADAICLANVIKQAKAANRQWYALHTLLKYQRQRKAENRIMEASMTGFKTLFGQDNPVLSELRNTGLNIVNQLPSLKKLFIGRALGGF